MTIDLSPDELAGVVDLFGALTRPELKTALVELAFKQSEDPPDESLIDTAIESYHLVKSEDALTVGPTAFPVIPDGGTDLPHIMDIESRKVDRDRLGRAVEERFRTEAARAVATEDEEAINRLIDVSYDLETWGPVELANARELLAD